MYGNPLGCVQVPDSVTSFDPNAVYDGLDETARCGDNCTELIVYVPSDGVCVQCPNGMRALGVGALNCSVLSSARCSLRVCAYGVFVCVHASMYLFACRWYSDVKGCVDHEMLSCATYLLQCAAVCCSVLQCVAVCCSGCSVGSRDAS